MRASPLILISLLIGCSQEKADGPALVLSTDQLEFTDTPIGSTATQDVLLSNEGDGSISILSTSLSDGEPANWAVDKDGADALSDGATITLTVSFSPSAIEDYTGQIQVRSDDPNVPYAYIDLSGNGAPSTADVDADGYSPAEGDCDDANPARYPGNTEICDGVDNDCNDSIPSNEADADYDGSRLCSGDCDDSNPAVYPGATEICDTLDNDCDGNIPDNQDNDHDSYTLCEGDCDDTEPLAYGGGVEVCDGVDNDCTGLADDIDADGDGAYLCTDPPDCDDNNPNAYPVIVDASAQGDEDGTLLKPFHTLSPAFGALDTVCHTIYVFPGTYPTAMTVPTGNILLAGVGNDPRAIIISGDGTQRIFTLSGGSNFSIQNLTISGSSLSNDDGGAIWGTSANLTLDNIIATSNESGNDGGFAWIYGGTITVSNSILSGNTAGDDGGAITVSSGTLIESNNTWDSNSGVRGGAVFTESSSLVSEGSIWTNNQASGYGGGAVSMIGGDFQIVTGEFMSNTASQYGGALLFSDAGDSQSVLANLLIVSNNAGISGGGISISGDSAAGSVRNNTLAGNDASGSGGGLYIALNNGQNLSVSANIIGWSNGSSGCYGEGGVQSSYNLAYASASGTDYSGDFVNGNNEDLIADPLFQAWSNDDTDNDIFSLSNGSPAHNSGPSDSAWNDTDGSRNDRGYTGGPYAP